MRRLYAFLLAGLLLLGAAWAAQSSPSTGTLVPSLADFNALESRVTALEQRPAPTVTVTPTPTPTPTETPTPTPTETPTTPPPTTPTTPPTQGGWPNASNTGVPAGWTPARTVSGDYRITTAGTVVSDLRVNGRIIVDAPNVTIRRVEVIGGGIANFTGSSCRNGLVVEDTTIRRGTGPTTDKQVEALGTGGYTARRVKIDGMPEGFRVSGKRSCGPVTIVDSYARVVRPDVCGDWHGDGIQGYDGNALTVRNTSLELIENGCGGTAAFFYPAGQGNTSVDIDGLRVTGGGYTFRLGMPGTVRNLAIVQGAGYGPIDVKCSVLTAWDARIITAANATVRTQPCNTETGN